MGQKTYNSWLQRKFLPVLATGTFHGLGILLLAILIFIPFITTDAWAIYLQTFSHAAFLSNALWDILLHVGLAACIWALGFIAIRLWALRDKPTTSFRAARGSVMVETLIVIVPFLLLTSGIAQLTILNITGVLAHVASYQATRTVWVWQPEADKGRMGVNNTEVNRRARLAAAAIMAPSAPADYSITNSNDKEFVALRGTMTGAFSPDITSSAGSHGKTIASVAVIGGKTAISSNLNYAVAFDSSNFMSRAARKLTFAYAASNVTVTRGETITTRLEYQQNVVFPWFSYIWGTTSVVGGRPGKYVKLTRTFSMPAQVSL